MSRSVAWRKSRLRGLPGVDFKITRCGSKSIESIQTFSNLIKPEQLRVAIAWLRTRTTARRHCVAPSRESLVQEDGLQTALSRRCCNATVTRCKLH